MAAQDDSDFGQDNTEQEDLTSSEHVDDPSYVVDEDGIDEPEEISAEEGAPDNISAMEQLQASYNEGSAEVVQGGWAVPENEDEEISASKVAVFDKTGNDSDYNDYSEGKKELDPGEI